MTNNDMIESDRLEWFLYGGDGDEYELWHDPHTAKIYRVPIKIVRDWDNITEENDTDNFIEKGQL